MTEPNESQQYAANLRQQVEERLQKQPATADAITPEETVRLLHELQVHQIELEMQNEELRRAQQELETSRARYFDLYNLAPVGYVTLSEPGLIVEANLAAATMLGVDRSQLVKQPLTRFIVPDDQDIYYRYRQQLFETGVPQACELRLAKKDSSQFWARLEAAPALDAVGAPAYRVVLSDITERQQANEALRQSEVELAVIYDNAPLMMLLVDRERRVLKANRAAVQNVEGPLADMVGLRGGEALKCLRSLDDPTGCGFGLHCASCGLRNAVFDTLNVEHSIHRKEVSLLLDRGGPLQAQVLVSTALLEVHGQPAVLVCIEDITARKRAEAIVNLNEERLNSLLELSQKASELSEQEIMQFALEETVKLTHSKIGYLHFVNPDQQTLPLVTWSKATLETCDAAYDNHYPLAAAGVWADCVRLKRPVIHNDYQNLAGKKEYPAGHVPLSRHLSVPVLDGEQVSLIVGVGNKDAEYDETDVRQVSLMADDLWQIMQRRQAEEQLKAALAEKEVLVREIHHRVKNNLQTLVYLIEMQAETGASPAVVQALQDLQGRVRAMAIVHEKLYQADDLSRIDFGEYVEELAAELSYSLGDGRHIALRVEAAPVLININQAIPCGLIVNELVTNALKYAFPPPLSSPPMGGIEGGKPSTQESRKRAEIWVGFELQEDDYVLTVGDNGIGLPPEVDWRAAESLGLRMVNLWATHQLGGSLHVATGPGVTLTIRFPARGRRGK